MTGLAKNLGTDTKVTQDAQKQDRRNKAVGPEPMPNP